MKNSQNIDPNLFIENSRYGKKQLKIKSEFINAYFYKYRSDLLSHFETLNIDIFDVSKAMIDIVNTSPDTFFELCKYKSFHDLIENFDSFMEKMVSNELDTVFGGKDAIFDLINKKIEKRNIEYEIFKKSEEKVKKLIAQSSRQKLIHFAPEYKHYNGDIIKNALICFDTLWISENEFGRAIIPNSKVDNSSKYRVSSNIESVNSSFFIKNKNYSVMGYGEVSFDSNRIDFYEECDEFIKISREFNDLTSDLEFFSRFLIIIYSRMVPKNNYFALFKHKDYKFYVHMSTKGGWGSIYTEDEISSC